MGQGLFSCLVRRALPALPQDQEIPMRNVLFVSSSLMAETSTSRKVGAELVARLKSARPNTSVTERHLQPDTIPHLSRETLVALGTPADQRSAPQQELVRFADRFIEEVEA